MAKVRVTTTITVRAGETSTVHYEAGFEGTAPSDHIARIVAAGAGEAIEGEPSWRPDAAEGA